MSDDQMTYCRSVEEYLTRANGGHLVRIVGPAFELVRGWADDGVPLSVVFRGIDAKVARHRSGAARRPLRIEFCEADVREGYDAWRRAIGVAASTAPAAEAAGETAATEPAPRRPSLAKHLDRAVARLGGLLGRMDLPETFRDAIGGVIEALGDVRERARTARGSEREALARSLADIERVMMLAAREVAGDAVWRDIERTAAADLAAFRSRLSTEKWDQAVATTADRLLRERMGLPTIIFDL